jgi:hypothetical protein
MTIGELLLNSLGFHAEDDVSGDLAAFCDAWAAPLEGVYDIVRERDDAAPWAVLFDVDNCPAESLPYLAQFVGVILSPEMSEEDQRDAIREPVGWSRGRTAAIEIAALSTLTGTRRLVIKPRTPEVGVHYIRTLASETPNPDRTEAVLRAALPAWETLDYEAYEGATYGDLDAAYSKYSDADAAFATYGDETDSGL